MRVPFVKMHGAGNDFVMIDDREERFPVDDPVAISRLANRPDGIGCEGVIVVRDSDAADFRMRFFNPDGSEADLCGNGARCVAAFALAIGAARSSRMRFETAAGLLEAEVLSPGLVRVAMPDPRDLRRDFVNSGVPHAIVPVTDLEGTDVDGRGREIRYSEAFRPQGTNVDFVRFDDAHTLHIRTYERGVELETFACGTGSVAAAVVGVSQYGMSFPVTVVTARGVRLVIEGESDGENFRKITLTGPVQVVYSGNYDLI